MEDFKIKLEFTIQEAQQLINVLVKTKLSYEEASPTIESVRNSILQQVRAEQSRQEGNAAPVEEHKAAKVKPLKGGATGKRAAKK